MPINQYKGKVVPKKLGWALLNDADIESALKLLKLNIEIFPTSSLPMVGLGGLRGVGTISLYLWFFFEGFPIVTKKCSWMKTENLRRIIPAWTERGPIWEQKFHQSQRGIFVQKIFLSCPGLSATTTRTNMKLRNAEKEKGPSLGFCCPIKHHKPQVRSHQFL